MRSNEEIKEFCLTQLAFYKNSERNTDIDLESTVRYMVRAKCMEMMIDFINSKDLSNENRRADKRLCNRTINSL